MGIIIGNSSALPIYFSGPDGLSATAEFTLFGPTELQIILTNTSTGVPDGFSNSDQLLTGISFNLGGPEITGGSVVIGPDVIDMSLNFDNVLSQLVSGDDVSSEWGYGNSGGTGMLVNMVSTNAAKMTAFSAGPNLDGPDGLDGPQGGIIANPGIVDLGGLGAIQDSVVITLNLSSGLIDMSFLENGVIVEYGSDAAFLPEPTMLVIMAAGLPGLRRRLIR